MIHIPKQPPRMPDLGLSSLDFTSLDFAPLVQSGRMFDLRLSSLDFAPLIQSGRMPDLRHSSKNLVILGFASPAQSL